MKKDDVPRFYSNFAYRVLKRDMLMPRVRRNRFFGQSKCVPLAGILSDVFTEISGTKISFLRAMVSVGFR